ncbi:MAG: sigma-54 dependent transcriptional regulator [Candidatus Eisenbacteria bacterium]
MAKKILMIDDDLESVWRFTDALTSRGYSVSRCADPRQAVEVFVAEKPDAVLLDVKMPGRSGLDVLKDLRQEDKDVCVIMLSNFSDAQNVVEAIKLGADNFAEKDHETEKFLFLLEKELKTKDLEAQLRRLKGDSGRSLARTADIIGESEPIKSVKRQIAEYAEYAAEGNLTVFITGEHGVGKGMVAEALHTQSERRAKPFKHLLCPAFPPTLLEAALFGHEKGAFTDAYKAKKGFIEAAGGGTVFLDEIGVLSTDAQAKLLLLTETGVYSRVGAEGVSKKSDAWFLAATNIDVHKAIRENTFREDLFYRLNQAWIHVPPLRDRGDDVILLAEHFITIESDKLGRPPVALGPKFADMLLAYRWPGNVRQLNSVIRRYVRSGGKDVRLHSGGFDDEADKTGSQDVGQDLKSTLAKEAEKIEKRWITEALARFGGNRTKAAEWLGISRRSLMYKLKRYGFQGKV